MRNLVPETRLAAIETQAQRTRASIERGEPDGKELAVTLAARDVPDLVAEIRRLRGALDALAGLCTTLKHEEETPV